VVSARRITPTATLVLPASDAIIIPLTQGKSTIIDSSDQALICQYRWYAYRNPSGIWYARRSTGKRGPKIYMHREILDCPFVDHRDRDGLNNRRSNLRPATKSENAANAPRRSDSQQRFKGVRPSPRGRPSWVARIQDRHLGTFLTEHAAARAYDLAALETFGEFAWLNLPEEGQ
jgi:hypothetical protein